MSFGGTHVSMALHATFTLQSAPLVKVQSPVQMQAIEIEDEPDP